jgi:hypothetical protein
VVVAGFGSTRPLVPNDSSKEGVTNRRVEFVFERDPLDDSSHRLERRPAEPTARVD